MVTMDDISKAVGLERVAKLVRFSVEGKIEKGITESTFEIKNINNFCNVTLGEVDLLIAKDEHLDLMFPKGMEYSRVSRKISQSGDVSLEVSYKVK